MSLKNYVESILTEIKQKGEQAVRHYSKKFDDYDGPLKIGTQELNEAIGKVSSEDREVIEETINRVKQHHLRQTPEQEIYLREGSIYGLIYRPIGRAGLYIPGGRPLPSSLIMTAVPARIAGVEELLVAVPPVQDKISPHVLYTASTLGIDEIYKVGGAQAIGAFAYGAGLPRVDKIFGPGNQYVNEAKRQVYGEVGIDGLAGPSEICILADETAEKTEVLSDLRAQLEHGENSQAWLITSSKPLARCCKGEEIQVEVQPNLNRCVNRINSIAPEHLQVMTKDPLTVLSEIKNAGAIYLGRFSPAAAADYFLGVNHVLPTGQAAKFESVLTVSDFLKPISLAYVSQGDFAANSQLGKKLAQIEGMKQHKRSIEVREVETKDERS